MFLVVQHTVRDDNAWKAVYDAHESVRARYGTPGHTIYREADKPNDVTVFNLLESRARAEELARDPQLPEAMERGGVTSEPRIMWAEKADKSFYAGRRAA